MPVNSYLLISLEVKTQVHHHLHLLTISTSPALKESQRDCIKVIALKLPVARPREWGSCHNQQIHVGKNRHQIDPTSDSEAKNATRIGWQF